jgi:hypothetical protein
MKSILDDDQWTSGREAIEREKSAAKTWLLKRGGVIAPAARIRGRRHALGQRRGWNVAVGSGLVLAALLAVIWSGWFSPAKRTGRVSALLTVLQSRLEDTTGDPEKDLLGRAGLTDFAWSVQQVYCRACLESGKREALPALIERTLSAVRAGNGAGARSALGELVPLGGFSGLFSRVYKLMMEG